MRIYCNNKRSITSKSNLHPYFHETRVLQQLWSPEGLIQIATANANAGANANANANRLYRCRIKDGKTFKTLLGAWPVTIDMSEIIKENECYQILPEAQHESITQHVYKLAPTSSVECIIEYKKDSVHDCYLYISDVSTTQEDIIYKPEIKQDIMHILSLL